MCLSFGQDRSAIIHSSWLDPRKVREMTIVGSKRMVVYDDVAQQEKIRIFDARVERPPHYDTFAEFHYAYHYGDTYAPYLKQEEPLKAECQHFLDCIRESKSAPELRRPGHGTGENPGGLLRFLEARGQSGCPLSTARRGRAWPEPTALAGAARNGDDQAGEEEPSPDGPPPRDPARRHRLAFWRPFSDKTLMAESPPYQKIAPDVKLGRGVRIYAFTNLYGCQIGDDVKIGTFVEIQKGASIGNRCKISSHTFICEGVVLEDDVFVGHNVTFINDLYPRATNGEGQLQTEADWKCVPTRVERGASIGSGATLLCGITVGRRAIIGAGSVVTRDVPADAVVAGNPARIIRMLRQTVPEGRGGREKAETKDKIAMKVPFLDLKAHHAPIREQLDAAIARGDGRGGFCRRPVCGQI